MTAGPVTLGAMLRARADEGTTALRFEERSWSYRQFVAACATRAAWLVARRRPGPFHVGVLLDNVPDYPMLLGAAALSGATVVGINPTRRGRELARDVAHADCQLLVTEAGHRDALAASGLELPADRRVEVDSPAWAEALAPHAGATLPSVGPSPESSFLLVFTSGTTGDPKAAIASHRRVAVAGSYLAAAFALDSDDVSYVSMPLFHSNAVLAGWAPAVAAGACTALRRKFSASAFLPDVRRYGVTYFSYVGKPLAYVLATEASTGDADTTLRVAFGNEAAEADIAAFGARFGCRVVDAYGSTEGALLIQRTPDTPPGSLGVAPAGVEVLDPETGKVCPPARFDASGRLTNGDVAIGELANRDGVASFEGYWKDPDSERQRTRGGIYWSGDLGYRDADGFLYFAGRTDDWLRVDGENLAVAPIETILERHPHVLRAAVYAVPSPIVGDDVMAAIVPSAGRPFEAEELARFLADQPDLGTKSAPRYLRVTSKLPTTETHKVLKRRLRAEAWHSDDPVWLRDSGPGSYREMTGSDREALDRAVATRSGRRRDAEAASPSAEEPDAHA